jgi:hypothetical protein
MFIKTITATITLLILSGCASQTRTQPGAYIKSSQQLAQEYQQQHPPIGGNNSAEFATVMKIRSYLK